MRCISFFKTSSFYTQCLVDFYHKHPHLKTASYGEQFRALMDSCFAWADYWKTYLERSSHYRVTEIIYNASYLQKAWARENQFEFDEDQWQVQIVLEQLRRSGADVFFSNEGWFNQFNSAKLKQMFPKLFIIGYDGTAIKSGKVFGSCDLMLSCTSEALDYYEKAGQKTYLYKLGFETSILNKIHYDEAAERPYDVTFIGGVSVARNAHIRRVELLYFLSKHIKLNLFLMEPGARDLAGYWLTLIRGGNRIGDHFALVRNALRLRRLHRFNAGPIFGVEMYAALAKSKIALNVHIDSAADTAANFRLFEATGMGCCLLTDWKSNINELFTVDQEVVVYRSFGECLERIRELLKNSTERQRIAANGFRRTHSEHSLQPQLEKFGAYLLNLTRTP